MLAGSRGKGRLLLSFKYWKSNPLCSFLPKLNSQIRQKVREKGKVKISCQGKMLPTFSVSEMLISSSLSKYTDQSKGEYFSDAALQGKGYSETIISI